MVKLNTNQWTEKETKMDGNELAASMLEWLIIKRKLDEKEAEIKTAVLEFGKTVTTGNVVASYRGARQTFDYRRAAENFLDIGSNAYDAAVRERTTTIMTIDWKGICWDESIEQTNIPVELGDPSVTIKIVKPKDKKAQP